MWLLAKAHSLEDRGQKILLLKSSIDTRDGNGVIHSRSLGDRPCTIINPEDDIIKVVSGNQDIKNPIKFILVDEAQFLTEKQVEELANIVDFLGINVICYGLRTDFQTKLFVGSKRLFELADNIHEIESTCECGRKTIVNARIDNDGNVITDGEQIEVGGDDRYVALCRKCYYNRKKKK